MAYGERLAQAFAMAECLHRGQKRKGSEVPYLTHLMGVAALVGEFGGSEDQLIAALLHDAVEDQGGRRALEEITSNFGQVVADYVAQCSDTDSNPKPPWRERKERHIARLTHAAPEVKLICAADKLHNMRTLTRDLRTVGPGLWARFHGGREGSLWYFRAMLEALSNGWKHPILDEVGAALALLDSIAGAEERPG